MGVTPAMTGLSGMSGMVGAGGGGGPAFTPSSLANLRQYALDGGNAYETLATNDLAVLRSLEPYGTHRQPRQGRCYLFDGSNDYGNLTYISGITTFSVGAWVKMTLSGAQATFGRGIIRNINTTANLSDFFLSVLADGSVGFANWRTTTTDTTGYKKTAAGKVANATWAHVFATWDGTTSRVYVNGVEETLSSSASTLNGWGAGFYLGTTYTAGGAGYFSSGNLRDARFYNVAKNLSEIAAIMGGNTDSTGLISMYPCNEESGTTGYDISGNGNHLTLTNITQSTFHATDTGVTYNPANVVGHSQAISFDGVDDKAQTTLAPSGYTGISFGAWVRLNAVGSTPMVMSYGLFTEGQMELRFSGTTGFVQLINNANNTGVVDNVNLAGTGWNHLFCTGDGTSFSLYKNGVLVGTSTQTFLLNSTTPFVIGNRSNSNGFSLPGSIRDARIYNVVKTAGEVAAIHSGGVDTTGLRALYNSTVDESGNGNSITLTNGASTSILPRNEANTTKDIVGTPLQYTGKSPYPINVTPPCITGNGTDVSASLGSALMPSTADFDLSLWYYHTTNTAIRRVIMGQYTTGVAGRCLLVANGQTSDVGVAGTLSFGIYGGASTPTLDIGSALTENSWHKITLSRVANLFTLTCKVSGGSLLSTSNSSTTVIEQSALILLNLVSLPNNGRVADVVATTGGVTTYFPLQGGPGSSNTNRDLSYIKSDETYGVVASAIVNGTVADIWANLCPNARDWCVQYGGDIAANGAFLPGQISGSLAADGTAKTLTAGKFGNPYSRINFNPFTAAELNGLGLETAYAVTTARQSVSPTDTKFRRTAAAGDDRFFATAAALTGGDKTNAESYVS